MANTSGNNSFQKQDYNMGENTMHKEEQEDKLFESDIAMGLGNTNNIYIDANTTIGSIWNIHEIPHSQEHDYSDPSVDDPIYNGSNVQNDKDFGKDTNDMFNPRPFPRLKSSFLPRSSSAESASTTSTVTSNTIIGSSNHQPCQQQPLQSQDEQNVLPNYFSSTSSSLMPSVTRRLSVSSSDSSAAGTISSNPLGMEVAPTPINPYYNPQTGRDRYQNNNICEAKQLNETENDPKSVDELMANELNKLSFQERETINEEIHGVDVRNAGVKESPELLRKSFEQLDAELRKLRSERVAFDRSQRLFGDTTYLNTEKLRIMFLRCDLFDIKKAAKRLCDYAEVIHESFGDFALQRLPTLSDFNDLELRIIEAGRYQGLPGRDRAGRRILGNFAFDAPKEFGVLSRLRVSIYVVMTFLEDVETQRKGAVAISWWHNVSVDDFIIRKQVHARVNCVPMRLGAFHCCIPSEVKSGRIGKKIKAMAVLSVGSAVRPHLRFHTGSVVECIYALQSFGIHSDQIPISSSTGKLKTKQHSKWLELRRLKEDSSKNLAYKFDRIIECPNETDVLFGRGRPIMRHPGNAVLRSVVQLKLEEYAGAKSKKQTTDVTWEVVRILKGKFGARFLKEENIENNGLGWIEVSNETARQKVRIAFRDLRTKIIKTNAAEIEAKAMEDHGKTNEGSDVVKAKRKGESISPITTPSVTASSEISTSTTPFVRIDSSQPVQETDSSTSVFLAMDGTDLKRQRMCF